MHFNLLAFVVISASLVVMPGCLAASSDTREPGAEEGADKTEDALSMGTLGSVEAKSGHVWVMHGTDYNNMRAVSVGQAINAGDELTMMPGSKVFLKCKNGSPQEKLEVTGQNSLQVHMNKFYRCNRRSDGFRMGNFGMVSAVSGSVNMNSESRGAWRGRPVDWGDYITVKARSSVTIECANSDYVVRISGPAQGEKRVFPYELLQKVSGLCFSIGGDF